MPTGWPPPVPTRGSRPELYDVAPVGLWRAVSVRSGLTSRRGSRPELYDVASVGGSQLPAAAGGQAVEFHWTPASAASTRLGRTAMNSNVAGTDTTRPRTENPRKNNGHSRPSMPATSK